MYVLEMYDNSSSEWTAMVAGLVVGGVIHFYCPVKADGTRLLLTVDESDVATVSNLGRDTRVRNTLSGLYDVNSVEKVDCFIETITW